MAVKFWKSMRDNASHTGETKRIREVYERRAREIPEDYYALHHAGNLFIRLETVREIVQLLSREGIFPLEGKTILEVGCGSADWLLELQSLGANQGNMHGIDLMENRIAEAKARMPRADFRAADASSLPWPAQSFDLVLQFTVFTSILDSSMRCLMAREMARVLKPEGAILWYDFGYNNPANPDVKAVTISGIRSLFPECTVRAKRVTLVPPLARWLASRSWMACLILGRLRILNSHYLAVIRKQ